MLNPLSEDGPRTLVDVLNGVLRGPNLLNIPLLFNNDILLLQNTANLAATNPTGEQLVRLNRLLLENAFAETVSRSIDSGFAVTAVIPGQQWRVAEIKKIDAQVNEKVRYGEQYIVSRDGAGAYSISKPWRQIDYATGQGNFPLWESPVLRDAAWRRLFTDHENGEPASRNIPSLNYPDHGDPTSPDPAASTLNVPITFGAFPAFERFTPTIVPTTVNPADPEEWVADGNLVINGVGTEDNPFVIDKVVGNEDGAIDSVTVNVTGKVVVTGFIGGGGVSTITINADEIEIGEEAFLTSRQVGPLGNADNHWEAASVGPSGDISLIAPVVTIGKNSNVVAHGGGPNAGDVIINASDVYDQTWSILSVPIFGWVATESRIDIAPDARINAGNININSTSTTEKDAVIKEAFSLAARAAVMDQFDTREDYPGEELVIGTAGQGIFLFRYDQDEKRFETSIRLEDGEFNTSSIAHGDIDNDGDVDVVAGNEGGIDRVYLNNGDGTFQAGVDIGTDTFATTGVVLANIDGDAQLELMLTTSDAGTRVRQWNGATFGASTNIDAAVRDNRSIAAGDIDGDGDQDVVVVANGVADRVYRNSGGSFGGGTNFGPANSLSTAGVIGNVDGDAAEEVIIGTDTQGVVLYDWTGAALSGGTTIDSAADQVTSLALGNVDADTDNDLVVGHSWSGQQAFRE